MQTLAADVGGLTKVCLVLSEIVIYYFREFLYYDYMIGFFNKVKVNKNDKVILTKNNINVNTLSMNKLLQINSPDNSLVPHISFGKEIAKYQNLSNENKPNLLKVKSAPPTKESNTNTNALSSVSEQSQKTIITSKKHKKKNKITLSVLLCPCLPNSRKRIVILSNDHSHISYVFDIIHYFQLNMI